MSLLGHRMRLAASGGEVPIISRLSLNQSYTYSQSGATEYDHSWKSDGTKLFVIGDGGTDFISEYALSSAWDLSTATYTDKFDVTTSPFPRGLTASSDGVEFYVTCRGDDNTDQFTATAWDVSTSSYTATEAMGTASPRYDGACQIVDGGTKFIIADTNQLYCYSLSVANDITSSSYVGTLLSTGFVFGAGFCFSSDGLKLIASGYQTPSYTLELREYNLSTAWDITTATLAGTLTTGAGGLSLWHGVSMKPDGLKMYLSNTTTIHEYDII